MLLKSPKKNYLPFRRGLKTFIVAEGVLILSAYMVYATCNRSQATRKFLNDTWYLKPLLGFYYKTGALQGSHAVENYDRATWAAQDKLDAQKAQ